MLKPEHAQERLKAFRNGDATAARRERVAGLPEDLRPLARPWVGLDAEGRPLGKREQQWLGQAEAVRGLEARDEGERAKVFAALLPAIAPFIERAWRIGERLPYQTGYGRKAFRAPGRPDVLREARRQWLRGLLDTAGGYDGQDIAWLAAWAPYLGYQADALGILFAAAVEAGDPVGDEVFSILLASARGEHATGAMGRHVVRALLVAERPEGWQFVESLLLAAQRQEGLRQSVLEAVDGAHPEAFRRLLRLLIDHDLTRLSATIRAADVWFGLGYAALSARQCGEALATALRFLEEDAARTEALCGAEAHAAYLALWATAFRDAPAAIRPAEALLRDCRAERRFVGAHLLAQLDLPEAKRALLPALDDADLRVAGRAFEALRRGAGIAADLFERLERALPRFPRREQTPAPAVPAWPWRTQTVGQSQIARALVDCRGERAPRRLLPYLPVMDSYARGRVVEMLAKDTNGDAETRAAIVALVGDATEWVRERAIEALARCAVRPDEAEKLERLLLRRAGDLRRGVLGLLLGQPDGAALASADRLLAARDASTRHAGLELLREMAKSARAPESCRARARAYRDKHRGGADAERSLLDDLLLDARCETPTLDNALGLMDPARRTKPTPPRRIDGLRLASEAAAACVRSLDALIHAHRETPIRIKSGNGDAQETLLGNLPYPRQFPAPDAATPIAQDAERLPLRAVWERWWAERPAGLRDDDGRELLRASVNDAGVPGAELRYRETVRGVLAWLRRLHPAKNAAGFLLDAVEHTFAGIPKDLLHRAPQPDAPWDTGWRGQPHRLGWLQLARDHRALYPSQWSRADHARLYGLLRWMDEPGTAVPGAAVPRHRPALEEALLAYDAGGATEADLFDQLLGPRSERRANFAEASFADLRALSGRKSAPLLDEYPVLKEAVRRCRERIIEVERNRGDLPTAASKPARALRYAGGLDTLADLLPVLGSAAFVRGGSHDGEGKAAIFSHLVRVTFPGPEDTPEVFAERMRAAKIGEERLLDLAFYAPQWARHVERALGWPAFEDAVWWMHAHTKDPHWSVEPEIREAWTAEVAQRTPLTGEDLLDGAVDVVWFHRVLAAVGPERWSRLTGAARYASGGGGHKRAQLFADTLLGRIEKAELARQIAEKRNQDAVRALGLAAPSPDDLLDRYRIIAEFLRGGRQFGAQRQESEKRAARIGLENLARTAGFPDPARLQWAMEAQEIADLAAGPVSATAGAVTVTLAINALGEPDIAIAKNGKALKTIPAAAGKDPEIAALVARRRDIERQASRMRASLESAMCRGDAFTGPELGALLAHPVLAPMLRNLVFIGTVGEGFLIGYPIKGGRALEGHDGEARPVPPDAHLRIAHPHDLLQTGAWDRWQRDCFRRERVQPFKQVFRELYVRTETEPTEGTLSRRYSGHQVNPRQALALLEKRGWVSNPDQGDVRRTFHEAGLTAWLFFDYGWTTPAWTTPAEAEGLTVDVVRFTRRGEEKPLPLSEIPPRVFSEAMRDLDLIVGVAHQGGVDPEASASTVEMRAALLREACRLLRIDNVRIGGAHALVDGDLGTYSIHLGSAVVHRQPGGHLCIVPVHGQHRGRLFLPFADDDPRTAEVISKALLLARDTEIKDPTILEQILPRSR